MTEPLSEARLAVIRARFERTTHPDWRDTTDMGVLLAEVDRLNAELQRIQRWASETVHGSAAAEVLLLIRDLPAAPAEPFRNCFTDEAYRSSLTDSPERSCDRVQPHPAHKHVAQRASWQCPGVAATPSA